MANTGTELMTAEAFFEWCERPENRDRRFELEDGEVTEMPPPWELHGLICGWIAHLLWQFAIARNRGRVTTNDTGLVVERDPDSTRGVDVMFFDDSPPIAAASRQYPKRRPTLTIEVLSPSDSWTQMNRRVGQYLRHGVPLVWVVDPDWKTVTVFVPGEPHKVLEEHDELTGSGVLPDFRCRVADLFALPGGTADPTE